MDLASWDKFVRPYLQQAEYEARVAIQHVHKAGYLIAEICERPEWKTNASAELDLLETTLERALNDVRRVQKAYQEKRIETLVAAE